MSENFYEYSMILIFIFGYFFITIEHITQINKATVALMMAILSWVLVFRSKIFDLEQNRLILGEHLGNITQIILFLLGALTIVEIINAHKGFQVITKLIKIRSKRHLLWVVGILTFFLSSVLDNLTTTVVMISLLSKFIPEGEDRFIFGGGVVIAANAGGAWTPIGDVTTTMLWIGGQLSTFNLMYNLFLPSFVCFVVSFALLSLYLEGTFPPINDKNAQIEEPTGKFIFFLGIGALIFVPVFKALTNLPPFMGILFGLSVMWFVTDYLYRKQSIGPQLCVPHVMSKVDLSAVLFFLGILLCIDALYSAGILNKLSIWIDQNIGNIHWMAVLIGLASAIVDNVPLVAAAMGMYGLNQYPTDHSFWELIAYCAGTGGSLLIIGSAAGVAFLSLEKINFFWYLKRISLPAALGYFAGFGVYLLDTWLFHS